MVVNRYIYLIIILFFMISNQVNASLSASVDRTRVSENDIISLTIRSTDGPFENTNELAKLKRDFSILNTQRNNAISIVNGRREANYDLKLVLAPNRTGTLTIPSFASNGETSLPIDIEVAAGSVSTDQELRDVFLENEVSTPEAYVQEQILYTLKLHHSVGLEDASISPLDIENAVIEQLGEQRKYETVLEGIRYSVIELRYAIFPQSSGRLEIPAQVFSGRTTSQFLGFRAYDSRYVRSRSATHIINILPKPASYPQNQPWLPTWELKVQDSWQLHEPEFRVGEPVTRTISMVGRGLTAAQLPEINLTAPDGIKLYPDQLQSDDVVTDDGIMGQNSIATAFVPSQEGAAKLPGFTVNWWNTQRNRLEQTVIAPKIVRILPASAASMAAAPPQLAAPLRLDTTPAASVAGTGSFSGGYWPVATLVVTALWLVTLLLWWWSRREKSAHTGSNGQSDISLKQAFRELQKACRRDDPQAARKALIAWHSRLKPESGIMNLDAIASHVDHPELTDELAELNARLYGNGATGDGWSGKELLQVTAAITKDAQTESRRTDTGHDTLAPLYPL